MRKRIAILLALCSVLTMTGCQYAHSAGTVANTQTTAPTSTTTTTTTATETTAPTQAETIPSTTETVPATTQTVPPETETLPPETETLPPETETLPPETEPVIIPEWTEEERQRLWTPLPGSTINLWDKSISSVIRTIPSGAELLVERWYGKYAFVTYNGIKGYVTANYIQPMDAEFFSKRMDVLTPTAVYTYDQMLADMNTLQTKYPDVVTLQSIGTSEQGRSIPVMLLGNPEAPKHVLMQGAIHAREHFTAWLLMAIANTSLFQNLLDDTVCYHIIPMANPDGVIISQTQTLGETQLQIYQQDLASGYVYFNQTECAQQWKANALGIDLNRNFPSGWEQSLGRNHPSWSMYRGESPLCAAETKALADYTLSRHFDSTFSFHSHGSVLYYKYGTRQPVIDLSYDLATVVQSLCGYSPVRNDNTTGAGYKDWVMEELGIPSLTIEIGSNETPLAQRDIYNTYARFEGLLPVVSAWVAAH